MFWPRKHLFVRPNEGKELELRTGEKVKYPEYICPYCGKILGLEEWHLRRMPLGMATCLNDDAPRMRLKERLLETVDCIRII